MTATVLATGATSLSAPVSTSSKEDRLLKAITTCDATRALFERAKAAPNSARDPQVPLGRWTFSFTLPESDVSRGECDPRLQQIRLKESLSDEEAVGVATFELTNAAASNNLVQTWQDLRSGKITMEECVMRTEEIEHAGTVEHHKIMTAARRQMGWGEAIDFFAGHETIPFDQLWTDAIKDNDHAEYYRTAARQCVRERVKEAMRTAGYREGQIADDNLVDMFVSLADGSSDARLQSFLKSDLHVERTRNIMKDLKFSRGAIASYSGYELEALSSRFGDDAALRSHLDKERAMREAMGFDGLKEDKIDVPLETLKGASTNLFKKAESNTLLGDPS